MPVTNSRNNALLAAICLSITVLLFIVGLWPLNFSPANNVAPEADGRGLRFAERAIAYSRGTLEIPRARNGHPPQLTIELWARPDTEVARAVPRLLSLADDSGEWLSVGQWKSSLIIRSGPQPQDNSRGYREAGLRNALVRGSDTFLTITYGRNGTCIYTNGNLMRSLPAYSLIPPTPPGPTRVILGNSPAGNSYWTGTVYGLALYERELAEDEVLRSYRSWQETDGPAEEARAALLLLYAFAGGDGGFAADRSGRGAGLVLPPVFAPLQRTALAPPGRHYLTFMPFWKDAAVNIAGFVPLGFFFSAFLLSAFPRRRLPVYAAVTLLGLLFSLTIELVQVYLPTRDSSLADVVCNVVGTLAGILACHKLARKRQRAAEKAACSG